MVLQIRIAGPADLPDVRALWREYWDTLALPADFQGFEEERRTLPGAYAPPGGRLLVATSDGQLAGTGALRPLDGSACEAKRLYVRATHRGLGIGRAILVRLMHEASAAGYRAMYADTLPTMADARALYSREGFAATEPYSSSATPGALYLFRTLDPPDTAPTTR